MGKFIDLTGKVFHKLTVIEKVYRNKELYWKCKCDCGNEIDVLTKDLNSGYKKSCWCDRKRNRNKTVNIDYVHKDNYTICIDNSGKQFIIDTDDYELIKEYTWFIDSKGYVRARVEGNLIPLHRYLMNPPDDMIVDHINREKYDNRKVNLRIVTPRENTINRGLSTNNTSGHTGVSFHKNYEKWAASIGIDGKNTILGYFNNIEDAIKARSKAEEKYYGEFNPSYSVNIPKVEKLKEFTINGELSIPDSDISHKELINKLFEDLKKNGIYFRGETKEVKNK